MTDPEGEALQDLAAVQHNASPRSFARNVIFGYLGTAASMLSGFVVTPVLYRNLGVKEYALFGLITGISAFTLLADLGVGTATIRRVAAAVAKQDEEALWRTVRGSRVFLAFSAATSLIVLLIVAWRMPQLFSIPHHLEGRARLAMVITAVGVAVNLALSTPSMVIIGHGRSDLLSKRGLTLGLVVAGIQCVVALSHGGVVGTCTVTAVGSVLNAWIGFVQQRRVWRPMSRPQGGRTEDIGDILREGSANFVISVAGTVAFNSDTIILGAVAPLTAVAAYTLAAKLPGLIRVLSSRAIDLLQPTFSHFASSEDAESRQRLFRVLTRSARFSTAIAIALGIGACTSGDLLLHVWLGGTPSKTGVVLVLLMIGIVLQMFGHAVYVFLTGIRKLRRLMIFSLVSAAVNVGLSIVFTEHLGAPGPAIGSMICVLIGDLFVLPSISASALGVRSTDLLKRLLVPPLVPLLPAVALVLAFHVSTRSAWSLPVGALGAVVYLAGFWLLVGAEDRRYAVDTTRRLLHRSPPQGA